MGPSEAAVKSAKRKVYSLVIGPYLDIALRKKGKRIDWLAFTNKFLGGSDSTKIYYHFDYYRDDYRGSAYISKLEALGFKINLERLPPKSKEIVKEVVGVMVGTDIGYFSGSHNQERFVLKVVCPFKDLRYPLEVAKNAGAHVCLIDFSEPPPTVVAVASELIILGESENIYLSPRKQSEEKKEND